MPNTANKADIDKLVLSKSINTEPYEYRGPTEISPRFTKDTILVFISISLPTSPDSPMQISVSGITEEEQTETVTWETNYLFGSTAMAMFCHFAEVLYQVDPQVPPAIILSTIDNDNSEPHFLVIEVEKLPTLESLLLAYAQGDHEKMFSNAEELLSNISPLNQEGLESVEATHSVSAAKKQAPKTPYPIAKSCAECGVSIDNDAMFCMECIVKAAEQVIPESRKCDNGCGRPATKILYVTEPSGEIIYVFLCSSDYGYYKSTVNSTAGWRAE